MKFIKEYLGKIFRDFYLSDIESDRESPLISLECFVIEWKEMLFAYVEENLECFRLFLFEETFSFRNNLN